MDFLCDLESFHPYCYKDSSQSSIGFGTKCTGSSVQPHQSGLHSITREQALNDLVDQVYSRFAPNVRRQTKNVYMTQNQFDVLVCLCYNTGGGDNVISKSPLVKYLKGELTEAEARSRYSNYYVKSNNVRVQGLVNRRNKEADRFFGSSVSLGSGFSSDSSSYSAEDIRADMDIVNDHYTYIAYNRKQNTKEVVSALQRLLNYFENAELTVDGICGKDTRAAIKSFQRNHDLKVDGRFGVKCKRCMTRLVDAL